jgi:hypothetical protein
MKNVKCHNVLITNRKIVETEAKLIPITHTRVVMSVTHTYTCCDVNNTHIRVVMSATHTYTCFDVSNTHTRVVVSVPQIYVL